MVDRENGNILKIGIQKIDGKLGTKSVDLLRACGLDFEYPDDKIVSVPVVNFPARIVFLRPVDIVGLTHLGYLHAGIVGSNTVEEQNLSNVETLDRLGYGRCRLVVAVKSEMEEIEHVQQLTGLEVSTSYPRLAAQFFEQEGIPVKIITDLTATQEAARHLFDSCAGIVDIVESGDSLKVNDYKELITIREIEAVLIGNKQLREQSWQRRILESLMDLMAPAKLVIQAKEQVERTQRAEERRVSNIQTVPVTRTQIYATNFTDAVFPSTIIPQQS